MIESRESPTRAPEPPATRAAGAAALALALAQRLEQAGVPHCHLEPPSAGPGGGPARVHLLVDRRQGERAEQVVASLPGRRLLAPVPAPGVSDHVALAEDLTLLFVRVRTVVPVSLCPGETRRLPWEDLLLATRRRGADGHWVVDPDLGALLHGVWGCAAGRAPADPARLAGFVRTLLGAEAAAALPDLRAAVRAGLGALLPRPSLRERLGGALLALGSRLCRARRPVLAGGGLAVAFVGCDGSGKSTVTREVERWLGGVLQVERAYLGSGQGPSSWLRWPLLLAHRLLTRLSPPRQPRGGGGGAPGPRGWRRRLRPVWALALAREKRLKLHAVWRARQRGAVVICDRYPQNEIMGFNDGPLLSAWRESRSALARALARRERRPYEQAERQPPDLVVKLCVSAEVALRRKPDMTAAEVARRIAAVDALRFGRDTRILRVDADAPVAQVLRAVETGIWAVLEA